MAVTTSQLIIRAASVYLPNGMSQAEASNLVSRIDQGHATSVQVLSSIATSANRVGGDVDELARLFFLVFNRPPDLASFQVGIDAFGKGFSLAAVCEFVMNLGTSVFGASQSNQEFVNQLAEQMFADPDSVQGLAREKAKLTSLLDKGIITRVQLLEAVSRISSDNVKYERSVDPALAMLVGAGREATAEDLHTLEGSSGMALMRSALTLGGEKPYGTQPYFSINGTSLEVTNELSEKFTFNLQLGTVSKGDSSSFPLVISRDSGESESPSASNAELIAGVSDVDLSKASGDGADHEVYANDAGSTIFGPHVSSKLSGGAGSDLIVGGRGDDTIVGNAGADQLKGGEGKDAITGGDGLDSINLVEVVAAADVVNLGRTAASADTVVGFQSRVDKIDLSAALTPSALIIGNQIEYTAVKSVNVAALTAAATSDAPVYYISNITGGTGFLTLAEIEAALVSGGGATGETVLLIDDGTSTNIYIDFEAQSAPSTGAGTGLILVGILSGVTGDGALFSGDLIST
jgi:hypothetical protein